jgi:chromosome segregation ATPase
MTAVGKILVVLHLVMSVMFMAFAGAVFTAQKNWRTTAEASAKALTAANTKLKDQQSEFQRERTDTATKASALKDEITKLTGEKGALTTQVMTLEADNQRLKLANDSITDQASLAAKEAEDRKRQADLQSERNAVQYATREDLIKKLNEAMDKIYGLEVQHQQLVERHDRVLGDLRTFRTWNASKGLPTDTKSMVAQASPPPPLEGIVMDYRKEKKQNTELVEISLGSDDGLSTGHVMTVFDNEGKYLGQIRLTLVQADKAVGIVTQKAKNTVMKKGDNVTTKL